MDGFQFECPTKAAEITLQEETINLLFTTLSLNTLTWCSLAVMWGEPSDASVDCSLYLTALWDYWGSSLNLWIGYLLRYSSEENWEGGSLLGLRAASSEPCSSLLSQWWAEVTLCASVLSWISEVAAVLLSCAKNKKELILGGSLLQAVQCCAVTGLVCCTEQTREWKCWNEESSAAKGRENLRALLPQKWHS